MTTLSYLSTVVLSSDILASVIVSKTCGINVVATPIAFKKSDIDLQPGETSDSVTRTVQNTGTSGKDDCKYQISGTDWSGPTTMASTQTVYTCNTGTGIDCLLTTPKGLPFTSTPDTYLGLDAGVTESTNFQVSIPTNQQSGTYLQTITITLI
jgi:hypothetical protein